MESQPAMVLTLLFGSPKFPLNPLMPEIKWWRLGENQCQCALRFVILSYGQNRCSTDFLM